MVDAQVEVGQQVGLAEEDEIVVFGEVFQEQPQLAQVGQVHQVGIVENGGQALAGVVEAEGLLDEAAFTVEGGALSGNGFDLPVYLPATDVQYLSGTGSNNLSFEQINILGGTLTSGQTLALNAIGTATTANLQYVFPNNFTVNAGATMNVAPNVSVILQPAYNTALTVTDNGTITFNSGDTVNFADAAYSPTVLLSVNSGGVLNASGTAFHAASTGNSTQLYVGAGGQLTASISTFALTSVNLTAGSTDTIQFSAFATQLAINSGASVTVNSDDFSSSSATVVVSGDPNATINLENNYWGTTVTAQIAAKITDRNSAPLDTRPTKLMARSSCCP